jgi:uncharacterized cupin superfamily protein
MESGTYRSENADGTCPYLEGGRPWRGVMEPLSSGHKANVYPTTTPGTGSIVIAKKRKAGSAGRQTGVSPEGFREPFNIEDVPWRKVSAASTAFKRLGRYGGGSQVGVGIDNLKPGQYSNRFHYHLKEEEHIFILRGSATLILGTRKYIMKERDYCCFPAGQRAGHHLFNHTNENCLFMTIGDNHADEVVCFPKTGKARVRATGETIPLPQA